MGCHSSTLHGNGLAELPEMNGGQVATTTAVDAVVSIETTTPQSEVATTTTTGNNDVVDLNEDGEFDKWLSKYLQVDKREKAQPKEREIGIWIEIRLFISSTFIDTQG